MSLCTSKRIVVADKLIPLTFPFNLWSLTQEVSYEVDMALASPLLSYNALCILQKQLYSTLLKWECYYNTTDAKLLP